LTDRNPDPGDFKYMTSVTLGLNEVLLTATVLDNDPAKPERARALEMLKAATLVGGAVAGGATTQSTQPATTQAALLHFTAPSGKWQVVMDKQSFESVDEQPHDGAKAKEFSAEGKDGWMLSVFFEPAAKPGDAKIARAFYLDRMKKSPVHMDKLKLSGDGNVAKMEYMVSDIQQKHANLYLVHDGVWVDVHISKMDFTSADQAALDALCRSVRIEVLK